MSETVQMFMEATNVAVEAYAQGARTHKDQEPRRRQWLRIRDALRAVVEADLLVVPIGENEAFDAGYAEGFADGSLDDVPPRAAGKRYWPLETEHGWVVALCAIDTDSDPTFLTEKGAREWAERLNEREAG